MPLLPWLLNLVYAALVAVLSPWLAYRMAVRGKNRDGWGEKLLGGLPERESERPRLWFHAVSVGEVLQLRAVLAELAERRPDVDVLITTTTGTGLAVAREKYPQHRVCYFPLDFSWSVRRALRRVRPTAVVLVELELWPNFVLAARRERVPLALVNGRISERSFRGYRRVAWLMRRLLAGFDVLAVQTAEYAERLIALGAPRERVRVTGSIKFDRVETDRRNARTLELRRAFGIGDGERVFIAGSTQAPEEEYALETWLALRGEYPGLRLVLVPRHKERFEEVARLVERRGLGLVRRSLTKVEDRGSRIATFDLRPSTLDAAPVLLLDTLGELAACWGLADVAFVGGSLTNRGGQNMIEPAAYGAAVLFGPNTRNFRDVVDVLLSRDAASVVTDQRGLTEAVRAPLRDPEAARRRGRTAQELVLAQQGATARTVAEIVRLLPEARDDRAKRRAA